MLNKFTKLKTLDASDNYISSLNLTLPKLLTLDLRNNFIEKVPNLQQLPMLQKLDLSTNKLSQFRLLTDDNNLMSIERMNFSNNKISFVSGMPQVTEFCEKLKRFKKLSWLSIANNQIKEEFMD